MHQHVVQGGELREIGITRVRPSAAPSGSSVYTGQCGELGARRVALDRQKQYSFFVRS
jgi:hypothetical protein